MQSTFKISASIYIRAVITYAIITLPSVIVFPIYVSSLFFAFLFGSVSCFVFATAFYITKELELSKKFSWVLLVTSIPISIVTGYICIASYLEVPLKYTGLFILFPLAAIIAGYISLFLHRKLINKIFE